MNTPPPPPPPIDETQTRPRMLRRPANNRMIAGVAAGIAEYLAVDVTVVRIVIAVLTVAGGAGIALYIAGWLLMPTEGAAEFDREQVRQVALRRLALTPGQTCGRRFSSAETTENSAPVAVLVLLP